MISDLLIKLGLVHVDPVGATGDSPGTLSGVCVFFDLDFYLMFYSVAETF